MLKDVDSVQAAQKYTDLKVLIDAVERMPKQIKECKFKAPPFIPKEFRTAKMPSNLFFSSFEFTMMDLIEHVEDLKKLYGPLVSPDMKKKIDRGD